MNDADWNRLEAEREAMSGADMASAWRELHKVKQAVHGAKGGKSLLGKASVLIMGALAWPFAHMKQH